MSSVNLKFDDEYTSNFHDQIWKHAILSSSLQMLRKFNGVVWEDVNMHFISFKPV
jgi:hypothetical protein